MNRLPSIRRWGVAALTGVTLFGGLSIVGAGVASAATTPTVTSALETGASATTLPGTTASATTGAAIVLTVSGTPTVSPSPDVITLTLACPSTGSAEFASATVTTAAPAAADFSSATTGVNTAGCSTLTLVAAGTVPNPVITVTPSYTTTGVTSQALTISGSYSTSGLASTTFGVPTAASVLWYNVSSNTPAVTLGAVATTALSPIAITDPSGINANDQLVTGGPITLTLPTGDTWSGTPTLSAVGAGPSSGTGSSTLGAVGTGSLVITVGTAPTTSSALFTISNASITTTTGSPLGSQHVTITAEVANPTGAVTAATGTVTLFTNVSAGTLLGTATTIYGADGTADGTVAAEFENAFPASNGGNRNVVLATDTAYTNGSDALAASYLEGTLDTGLLITPSTTLGADAKQALQLEGVTTVYVVGGPLAVSPAVIAQIEALPAYNAGGLTTTNSNIKVVGPIYGADGTAQGTAAAIATYFGTAYGAATFPAAYTGTGGAYNATTGSASTTAPTGTVPTAVVVAANDWQDAMSIAPEAFKMRFPVILAGPSTDTTLATDAQSALTSLGVKQVIIVGGQLAVQNSVETQIAALNGGISVLRIAGIDATGTSAEIANFALSTAGTNSGLGWTAGNHAVLASHADYWSDALGAAALGGGANAAFGTEPIILVENPTTVGQYTTAELSVLAGIASPNQIYNLTVLGGPLAMPSSTVQTLLAGL